MSADVQQALGIKLGRDYPLPVVDHAIARARTLARFGQLRSGTATETVT
jgi:deoxyribodipyrimidine photo-lyase